MISDKLIAKVLATLAVIVCLGNLISQPLRALGDPFNTDFVASFRVAAQMIHSGSNQIYCTTCFQSFTYQLYGMHPAAINDFAYPPLVAVMMLPIALLTPLLGLAALLLIDIAALALAGKCLGRLVSYDQKFTLLVLGLASLPAAQGLALGQIDPLILLAFVAGVFAAKKESWGLAGILFGLALVKPQFVWLVPFALLGLRQWKALIGMGIVAAAWLATTALMVGWGGLHQLISDTLPAFSTQLSRSTGIPGLVFLSSGSQAIATDFGLACGFAAGILLIYLGPRMRRQPLDFLAIAALLSIATAPHSVPYTLLGATPALILWGQRNFPLALCAAIALNVAYLVDLALPPHTSYTESIWIVAAAGLLLWSLSRASRIVSTQNA